MMTNLIEFIVEDSRWDKVEGFQALCEALSEEACRMISNFREGVAIILLTNNQKLQELNRIYRNKDKPTNVLSFPAPEYADYPGDIALSYDQCMHEAGFADKALLHHAAHLVVHGLLHLNGFDHQEDDEAEQMEALERALLMGQGILDPYS